MTTPKLAVDVKTRWGTKRMYRNPYRHGGQPIYRNVTGIVSALPKEGIPRWAANTTAEWMALHMDEWTDLPAHEVVKLAGAKPWELRDRAGDRGSVIHGVMENITAGKLYTVEAEVEPWIGSAQQLHADVGLVPELTETTIFNDQHMYAGTFDFLGRLRAFPELGRVLIDYKTGKDLYEDMGAQVVGGYALGAQYYIDRVTGVEADWKPPDTCMLAHLTPEGYHLRFLPMHIGYRRAFLAALEIRKWESEGPKMSKADVLPRTVRWDELPGEEPFELIWLQKQIAKLTLEQKLEATLAFKEHGIPTKPSLMTHAHINQACNLIKLYLMSDPKEPTP